MHRTGFTPYFPLSKPDQILSKTNKYILFFLQVSFENIPLHHRFSMEIEANDANDANDTMNKG